MLRVIPASSFVKAYGFGIFLILYFICGIATIRNGHEWGDDWAQYVLHARNIVTGHPYADTGYRFNPDNPSVGPPSFPPGFPLLLAPVVAVFGVDILPLKIACFAFLVLALPPLWAVLTHEYGLSVAMPSMLMFALHDQVWSLRDVIGSESAYILLSATAMLSLLRDGSTTRSSAAARALTGAGIGALAFMAVACRSIGISLALAMLA